MIVPGPEAECKREHLFISYAWEDGALAEWLTLRLTAEGYAVWCDRFKLLGGESWPQDIDDAIKHRTFRMLHVISAHSLRKENPTKERQLALALQRERKEELFIPLNADGTKPIDLNWQLSDINYIPFQDWGAGLKQLLSKLEKVKTPKPLVSTGYSVATEALLPPDVIIAEPEPLYSNWFQFGAIPPAILRFTTKQSDSDLVDFALKESWPHKRVRETFYSLLKPPANANESSLLRSAGGVSWKDVEEVDGIRTRDLLFEFLNKSIYARCLALGLKAKDDRGTVYFPQGLVPGDRLRFAISSGRKRGVRVLGRRRSGAGHFRYHLGFILRARQGVGTEPVAQLKLRLHVVDSAGQEVPPKVAFRRVTKVRRAWWNWQQLLRQAGVMEFLSSGGDTIELTPGSEVEFNLARNPLIYNSGVRINEDALALAGEEEAVLDGSGGATAYYTSEQGEGE